MLFIPRPSAGGGSGGPESDPLYVAGGATDSELNSAIATVNTALAAKQAAATAATDTELSDAIAGVNTALAAKQDSSNAATDAELTAAVNTLNTALAGKAVPADITAAIAAHAADDATDAELAQAVADLSADIGAKQDAATAATDAELASAVSTLTALLDDKADSTDVTSEITAAIAAHASGDASDAELASAVSTLNATISALPTHSWGLGAPSAAAANTSTYDELDAAGQKVGEWVRQSGAWAKLLGEGPVVVVERITTTATQASLASGSNTEIEFDTEVEDASGMWSSVTPNRIVIQRAGRYLCTGYVSWPANSTGIRRGLLGKVETNKTFGGAASAGSSASFGAWNAISGEEHFTAGQQIRLYGLQNSGVALNPGARLTVRWVGV